MKIPLQNLFFALTLLVSLTPTARAAVTFTNTPAVVSNTYNGKITLQIAGLTNTETVVVQKFLDLNTNGIIDSGDWLVQQFNLTDGQAGMVIGGVTNFDVPGDLNSATGAITTTLDFNNGDFVQNIVGKYLYRLSSPGGSFTPITNLFTVTNFPSGQEFTGNVVSNATSTTLSNAVVVLFPAPRGGGNHGPGNPLAGTVANRSGSYTIQVPPGTYVPMAFRSNYVANYSSSPVLTLGGSQTITTNLTLTIATANISGQIVDAVSNTIVLPGIFTPVSSTNNQIAVSFSGTNGDYTERVVSGQWSVGGDDSGLIVHGYVGPQNGTNVNAGATGVTLAYTKATALFYGTVNDNLGNPLTGIDVSANDSSNVYEMDGYTDTNGDYFVGAVGSSSNNDPWNVQVSNGGGSGNPTNYIYSQPQFDQNGGTNLAVGQALQVDFTALLATNQISGNVQESGTNIVGVNVFANATINGATYNVGVDTDTNGNYSLNVGNGTWSVGVSCNGDSDSLDNILGPGTYQCPTNQNVTINNNNGTTNFIIQPCTGIQITTTSPLPTGEVNVVYNQFLQASSCNGNFNWSQTSGTLPGLSLLSNGDLTGTPTNSGVFSFTAQVMDGNGLHTNRQFSVSISNALQVITTSLPNGTNGVNYSQQLQAAGGVPFNGPSPYSWSLSSGSPGLPAGLTLDTNGVLSGMPATNGTFGFTAEVTDSLGGINDQLLSLFIINTNVPPLAIGTAGGQIIVLWPASAGTNFTLQTATNVAGPWVTASNGVPQMVTSSNGVPQISFLFTNTAPAAFFRLQQ
ncbi:MAG: putative Ig domain-containing protein [Verrucomicrobiota bacterium]